MSPDFEQLKIQISKINVLVGCLLLLSSIFILFRFLNEFEWGFCPNLVVF